MRLMTDKPLTIGQELFVEPDRVAPGAAPSVVDHNDARMATAAHAVERQTRLREVDTDFMGGLRAATKNHDCGRRAAFDLDRVTVVGDRVEERPLA